MRETSHNTLALEPIAGRLGPRIFAHIIAAIMCAIIRALGWSAVSDTTWLTELIRLRDRAGNPSVRQIAGLAGLSKTTVADTFAGQRLPPLGTLLDIVRALDGDRDDFTELWRIADKRVPYPPVARERPPSERELLQAILDELVLIRKKLDTMSAD